MAGRVESLPGSPPVQLGFLATPGVPLEVAEHPVKKVHPLELVQPANA